MATDETEALADQLQGRYREWLENRTEEELLKYLEVHCNLKKLLIEEIIYCDSSGRGDDVFTDSVREGGG